MSALTLVPGLDAERIQAVATAIGERLATDGEIRARIDGLAFSISWPADALAGVVVRREQLGDPDHRGRVQRRIQVREGLPGRRVAHLATAGSARRSSSISSSSNGSGRSA